MFKKVLHFFGSIIPAIVFVVFFVLFKDWAVRKGIVNIDYDDE